MHELLQYFRDIFFERRKNRSFLKILAERDKDPRTLYSPTDKELTTLITLDVSLAIEEAKNDLDVVIQRFDGMMDRRASKDCSYAPFILGRDKVAVVFRGDEADLARVVMGAVKEYNITHPAADPQNAAIIFGISNDLEAAHMAMRMRRKHKEEREELERDPSESVCRMLLKISERKLWASSLMNTFLAVAKSTKNMPWTSWHEIRHLAGVHRIPENVRAVIDATDIRGLSALPLERQAAYVYELFVRSVHEELTTLLEKGKTINRDELFSLYALQLVIEQDRVLIGQDSTDVF